MQVNNNTALQNYSSINQRTTQQAQENPQDSAENIAKPQTPLQELSEGYNLRSMTASERLEFANKAVSTGELSLKEAAGLLPPPNVQRVKTENGYEIQEQFRPENQRFDVLQELQNSIDFSRENGGSKGIEIRESLLSKLQHLTNGKRINQTA